MVWPQTLTLRQYNRLQATYRHSPFTLPLDSLGMENNQPLILEALSGYLTWLGPWHLVAQLLILHIINGIVDILGGISAAWCVTTTLQIEH